jgi:hypothetical protein
LEAGAWGRGKSGARNVGRTSWSLSIGDVPRDAVRPLPVKQCDDLDTMRDLLCICKDALNESFLPGRSKGCHNKESARQQSFLWPLPVK